MANDTSSNPLRYDSTTGATWTTGVKKVRLIQWVDLNEDIADSDMCLMTINGVAVEAEIQIDADDLSLGGGVVAWQIGPFNPGIPVHSFVVTTLDAGAVYVWCG
jgi:hypothetical protein